MSPTALTPSRTLPHLQSSLLPSFRFPPILISSSSPFFPKPHLCRRIRHCIRASANSVVESGNGAVAAADQPEATVPYGRQYFPLAAVVGQVL